MKGQFVLVLSSIRIMLFFYWAQLSSVRFTKYILKLEVTNFYNREIDLLLSRLLCEFLIGTDNYWLRLS